MLYMDSHCHTHRKSHHKSMGEALKTQEHPSDCAMKLLVLTRLDLTPCNADHGNVAGTTSRIMPSWRLSSGCGTLLTPGTETQMHAQQPATEIATDSVDPHVRSHLILIKYAHLFLLQLQVMYILLFFLCGATSLSHVMDSQGAGGC